MKLGGGGIRRWLFNAAALLSLLLCVAVCVGRARTWHGSERVGNAGFSSFDPDGEERLWSWWLLTSERGFLLFERGWIRPTDSVWRQGSFAPSRQFVGYHRLYEDLRTVRNDSAWNDFGFFGKYSRKPGFKWFGGRPSETAEFRIGAPYWVLILVTGALPLWALPGLLRRRPKPGMCRQCGYDLRASKNACPECGEAIPATQPTPPA
ncbi:MAG: hypothetical protein NTW19_12125 [Planctomycetota bacterium]|nr:hypothetical protein [Planctomycetota bacterium]